MDSEGVKLCLSGKNAEQVVIEITSKDSPYILFGQYSKQSCNILVNRFLEKRLPLI